MWVIGNGFDLNLGLKTGYSDFLRSDLFLSDDFSEQRNSLCRNVGDVEDCGNHWSDLEMLLGMSTRYYSADDDTFAEIFEQIQRRFVEYVSRQIEMFSAEISEKDIQEFWQSICRFYDRIPAMDREKLRLKESVRGSIHHKFISLNYSDTFDRFVAAAKKKHAPFDSRTVAGMTYSDRADAPFHLHGTLENGGSEIVFGVSFPEQMDNQEFAADEGSCELWVKSQKNGSLFGNKKTEEMKSIVSAADVICVYGCSLGKSDDYIWREVGKRLKSSAHTNLVLFVHGLPDRAGQLGRQYQKARDGARDCFFDRAGIAREKSDEIKQRILFIPSGDVFRFKAAETG